MACRPLASYGCQTALILLAGFVAVVPALAGALRSRGKTEGDADGEPALAAREALTAAFGHGSYLLLVAGFFVCGFHIAFITTHLPAHLCDAAASAHGDHGASAVTPGLAA